MTSWHLKWQAFWCGLPQFPFEHIFSVDLRGLWRQHVVWSKRDGAQLKALMTQRFASNTVMLTLLISTEIGVFFSPSSPVQDIREKFKESDVRSLPFYTGIILCWSVLLSISAFTANFSAWSVISAISDENVHAVLRSSIGLYAAVLPGRLVLLAIYFFFAWVVMFWWVVLPIHWATALTAVGLFMVVHVASTYSALGRVIMHSGAMSNEQIFTRRNEERMNPQQLHQALIMKTKAGRQAKIPVNRQYRINYQESVMNLGEVPSQSSIDLEMGPTEDADSDSPTGGSHRSSHNGE